MNFREQYSIPSYRALFKESDVNIIVRNGNPVHPKISESNKTHDTTKRPRQAEKS
jgi:hypothetical protein